MLSLTRPKAPKLERLLEQAKVAELTYPEAGATADGTLPGGYRVDRYERPLGAGEEVFARAERALRGWQAHLGAGVEIVPAGAEVGPGETVLFVVRSGGLWAVAPTRVVYVHEEPDRFAFAYGTLPGHPERGEAAMSLERGDGGVVFRIVSFSRTVDPLARLGSPIARRVQRRVTDRYLDAVAAAAAAA